MPVETAFFEPLHHESMHDINGLNRTMADRNLLHNCSSALSTPLSTSVLKRCCVQFKLALKNREDRELFYSTPAHAVPAFFTAVEALLSSKSQLTALESSSHAVMVRPLRLLLNGGRSIVACSREPCACLEYVQCYF